MKESVALAKEVDTKKEFSATKSDNSIQRLRNVPERQLDSLGDVIGNIRRDGGTPSVESIATQLSRMPTGGRAPALLALQRTHGNRYVQRVVAGIQAKLKVGQLGDIYEQEADRVADAVMRMPEPKLQRASACGGGCLMCQSQSGQPSVTKSHLQTPRALENGTANRATPSIVHEVLNSQGQSLESGIRTHFEQRFGHDFSKVKIHTGEKSLASADAVNARAYTVRNHIVFGVGYGPSRYGENGRLLAHELTHSIQQESTNVPTTRLPSRTENRPIPITQHAPMAIFREQRVPVDPEIASLPGNLYVDAFQEAYYDLSYRAEGGNLSTWLTVSYSDGTLIDINIYDFAEVSLSPIGVSNSMRQGYVGVGNRIYPRQLTPQTAPRLWAARNAAIEVMEQYNLEFMMTAMPVVFFILSLVGGVSSPRATARPASRPRIRPRSTSRGAVRQTPGQTPVPAPAAAQTPRQAIGYTRHARGAAELGGFRSGITHQEIAALNRQFGGTTTITGHPSSALAAASRQQGFWSKAAAIVREIAGRHMFNDANKRTAAAIVNELRRRNNVFTGVEGAQLRRAINDVATGSLRTIEEIMRALRGF